MPPWARSATSSARSGQPASRAPSHQLAVTRIITESLTNALRHQGTKAAHGRLVAAFQLLRRMGTSAAISAIAITTVLSATLGGDVLAGTPLWILAFSAWPETAAGGPRLAIALIAGCVAVAAHRALTGAVNTSLSNAAGPIL